MKIINAKESFYNIANRAIVGGLIGSGLTSILVLLTFQGRFFFDSLMVLGSGGFLGGAVFGIILGMPNKQVGVTFGGIIGGIVGCALFAIGTIIYAGIPWPSPQIYPDIEFQLHHGTGSWGQFRTQTYTLNLPLNDVQQYYNGQMSRYCVDDAEKDFEESSNTEYQMCIEASCDIPRLGLEQYFRVQICSISETQTIVNHHDAWQD